ncbi:ADAM 17-like protease isoform X2 [Actinia tenebrosa]|uniref:ADAM 17-like protease isoform X2 n=1 Tax=Actinia tenebrosa TaxID=6105 RepID=A0A6P8HS31_ACTTE|nr:ADAM 17-like protease isoform X2 [Actinia tenebrosa]
MPTFIKILRIFAFSLLYTSCAKANLKDILKDYNTLEKADINNIVTRRNEDGVIDKVISFKALGRKFLLHLSPNEGLFSKNFEAFSVTSEGKEERISIDKLRFYKGYVEGESDSHVSAHLKDGLMTATIATSNETYIVEPSWRHISNSSKDQMISYRHSDVKFNVTFHKPSDGQKEYSFCGNTSPEIKDDINTTQSNQDDNQRNRRAALPTKLRCPLALVADYRFYKEMGDSDEKNTINYMIGIIDRVDQIYKSTVWSSGYGGFGFEIGKVLVHKGATTSGDGVHYNMERGLWNIKSLLKVFSYQSEWKKFCLAHLFTYQDFADGVIGLAYVGNPRRNAVGGICTEDYRTGEGTLYLNTGLSSSINWNRRVLTEEADIVTAHEFGHNFGSEHDPDNAECAPSERSGGKYIMYPASVSGQRANNKRFSPCSKRQISAVLKAKSQLCFTEPRERICGNYKKEPGEECDPGNLGTSDSDCCTMDCKLKPGAQCSDGYDSPCCKGCHFVQKRTICRNANPSFCEAQAFCKDNEATCPESPPLPDNTTCIERGKCKAGKCVDFCVGENLLPCMCTNIEDGCKVCCQKDENSTCVAWKNQTSGGFLELNDGRPCVAGRCRQGKCEKSSQDAIERFWSLLTNLDINTFVEFMRANIVGTIMFFSLCIWIPVSCIVHRIDVKNDKEVKKEIEWRDPKNTQLLRPVETTRKGEFIYRQDSFMRPSKATKPLKLRPVYVKTHRRPTLDVATVNESSL